MTSLYRAAMSDELRPFRVDVPQPVLDDLRERLGRTRWPDQIPDRAWDYGTDLAYLQEFYRKINEEGGAPKHHVTCPKCQHAMDVDMVTGALLTEGGGSGQSGPG